MKKYYLYTLGMLTIAVILGAFGAHAWKDILAERNQTFQLANDYHVWTSMAGILLVLILDKFRINNLLPVMVFLIGAFCFYSSLYLLSFPHIFTGLWRYILGPVTPLGGVLMIFGLAWNAWAILEKKES